MYEEQYGKAREAKETFGHLGITWNNVKINLFPTNWEKEQT
jgi:hypothetical protein